MSDFPVLNPYMTRVKIPSTRPSPRKGRGEGARQLPTARVSDGCSR